MTRLGGRREMRGDGHGGGGGDGGENGDDADGADGIGRCMVGVAEVRRGGSAADESMARMWWARTERRAMREVVRCGWRCRRQASRRRDGSKEAKMFRGGFEIARRVLDPCILQ